MAASCSAPGWCAAGVSASTVRIYLGILAYSAIWVFGQLDRTPRLGTYEDFVAGRAPWFYTDSTFVFMLVFTLVVWAVGMVVFVLQLRAEGKHLDIALTRQTGAK